MEISTYGIEGASSFDGILGYESQLISYLVKETHNEVQAERRATKPVP